MTTPAAAVNPYLLGGSMALDTATGIIGMIMQQSAMDDARQEARGIDQRNFAEDVSRDRFGRKMQKENLALGKRSAGLAENRFGLESTLAGYGINKDILGKVTDLLNSNNSLRDRVLRNWSL